MSFLLAPEVSGTAERDLGGNAASDLMVGGGVLGKPEGRLVTARCQTKRVHRAPFSRILRLFDARNLTNALKLVRNRDFTVNGADPRCSR